VRPEGLCQLNNPITPSGIDPTTFQFVAQCLNTAPPRAPYCLSKVINVIDKVMIAVTAKTNICLNLTLCTRDGSTNISGGPGIFLFRIQL
jgi:hypothetical protein